MFSCGFWWTPIAHPGSLSSSLLANLEDTAICTFWLVLSGLLDAHENLTHSHGICDFPWPWPLLCPVTSCHTALLSFILRLSVFFCCLPLPTNMSSHVSTMFSRVFILLRIFPLPEIQPSMTQRWHPCQVGIGPSAFLREVLRTLFWFQSLNPKSPCGNTLWVTQEHTSCVWFGRKGDS